MSVEGVNPKADPLDRPCKMRPISPVEVVNQLVAARRQTIGKSKWEAIEREEKAANAKLADLRAQRYLIQRAARIGKMRRELKSAERALADAKLQVDDSGNLQWTWEESRRVKESAAGKGREARLDQLAQAKADALASLIGLDIEETRAFLQRFKKSLEAI